MFNWIKEIYYNWYIDNFLLKSRSGISNTSYLNPFGNNSNDMFSSLGISQDYQKRQMLEAVTMLKYNINASVGERTKENYHRVLEQFTSDGDDWKKHSKGPDMLDLTKDEQVPEWKKLVYRHFIAKKADIVSKKDKSKMIDKRMKHYQELQIKKQIRSINKRLRQAERSGDKSLASELRGEIHELTRKLDEKRPSEHIIP